jgi:uncharacterized membrane protein (UPF0182 family)
VSQAETLLCQEGSSCTFGDLLTVPIGQSLLYVWPLYVESNAGQIPELRRVVVSWNGSVIIRPTLSEALERAFGSSPETLEVLEGRDDEPATPGEEQTPPDEEAPPEQEVPSGDVATLLAQAAEAFQAADAALADGDLARYEEQIDRARRLVEQANVLSGGGAAAGDGGDGGEGGDASTTTTSTTTSSA